MLRPEFFYNKLNENGTECFFGVPDSLLKNFCAYITDNTQENNHIITANEGSAVAMAAGYHLATGKIALVYMQNSGEGNAVNPLLSLCDKEVYSIPTLLLIGQRGEVGIHDEPQHIKQGRVTTDILDAMEIPYGFLSDDEDKVSEQLKNAYSYMKEKSSPYALIVRKGTFSDYILKSNSISKMEMTREEAIEEIICNSEPSALFVSTTGMISRELYELRIKYNEGHQRDFLTVGSMGHASSIAFEIAIQKTNRSIFCLDGDGAVIMHMGTMAIIGEKKPNNLVHIVLNNGAHDSVGGQPTVGFDVNLSAIAKAVGYKKVFTVKTKNELVSILREVQKMYEMHSNELTFIEVQVKKGARKDLGRPKSTPIENKHAFMRELSK